MCHTLLTAKTSANGVPEIKAINISNVDGFRHRRHRDGEPATGIAHNQCCVGDKGDMRSQSLFLPAAFPK
jgi:hypothetical protein